MERIVGGVEARVGEFPWQAAVLFGGPRFDQGCGGTLVSNQHVVTAAHCVYDQTPESIMVALGETTFAFPNEATSLKFHVEKIIVHEDYDTSSDANDISILKLTGTVDLTSYPNIKPACLPAPGATFGGQSGTVSGWGTVKTFGPSVGWLNYANVDVYESCSSSGIPDTTEDMICAGISEGGKDTCQGDSGNIHHTLLIFYSHARWPFDD